jgi:hypothetical protein
MTKLLRKKKNTEPFQRENDLCLPVSIYFRRRQYHLQKLEVPFYEYRIDVYCYSKRLNRTIAIELKLKRWTRAFKQALIYQLCSDHVYIAMPACEIEKVDQALLRKHGLGLISVRKGGQCQEVLRAKLSHVVRRHYRDDYIDYLNDRGIA